MSDRKDAARANAAAPATLADLHIALRTRLEGLCYGMAPFETRSGETRAPLVFDFDLPRKKNAGDSGDDQYPFFAVRPRSGSDSEQSADQNARATIDIEVGTFSDTDDGCLDVLLLIDAIREDLAAAPVLEGTAFEHVGPLTWEVPFPQPRPQWLGVVTTIWSLPRPVRVEARNPTTED